MMKRIKPASLSTLLPVAALTLLAFALRLYRIDADSIWWDEGISLHLARGSWAALIADRSGRLHPPLYFMLLKLWVGLAGDSIFSARTLSLLLGLPVVPLACTLAGSRWGRASGVVAAGLTAIAAVFVTYAQEVRVYALLPVVYLLLLTLADRLTRHPGRHHLWAALAITEAAAFLLHYLSAIALLYVNLRLILSLWEERRVAWRPWLVSQIAALALVLPWLGLVLNRRASVQAQFALGSSLSIDPLPLPGLVRLVWTFMLTGHDRARFVPALVTLGGLLAVGLAATALWLALSRPRDRRRLALATFDWLVPVAAATSLWALRPLSHPRYTLLWAGALWVWAGVLIARLLASRGLLRRGLATLPMLGVALVSALSLRAYFFDPFFAKQDVRGVAAMLRQDAQPGDVVLVPWQDQSLPAYDTGRAAVHMIDFRDPDAAWEALADATSGAPRVYVMEYDHTTRDPLGLTAYALERAGVLQEVRDFRGLEVSVNRLEESVAAPNLNPQDRDLGPAHLVGLQVDPAPADNAVTVALAWQADSAPEPLKATVQLKDTLGNTVGLDDRPLLDPLRRTVDEWPADTTVVNTYVLPLPQGTPPVTYDVAVALYPADETAPGDLHTVGQVTLLPPIGGPGDPYGVNQLGLDPLTATNLASGLGLTGALYAPREAHPGDSVDVMLRWQVSAPLPPLQPTLRLSASDDIILDEPEVPANGQYPTDRWSPGEIVLDRRRITLPPDSPPGALTLAVTQDEFEVPIGTLQVVGGSLAETPQRQHLTDVPFGDVARIIGYDLSGDAISPTDPLRVTLYWQATGEVATDYTVFVHLVAQDGTLLGQHDYPPVWGQRPTSGWRRGEFLVDVHDVTLSGDVAPSSNVAHLIVGLYDPGTLERIPLLDGSDAATLDVPIHILNNSP